MVLYMYLQARARADESLSAMLLQKRNFDKITNKMKTQGLLLKNLQSVVAAYKKSSSKLTKVIQGESKSYEFGIFQQLEYLSYHVWSLFEIYHELYF